MTELQFKILMYEYLLKLKENEGKLYEYIKENCGIKIENSLYNQYFGNMRNSGLITYYSTTPQTFLISPQGKADYNLIRKEIDKEKQQEGLVELQRENLRANTNDIKRNPFRFKLNLCVSLLAIFISAGISIWITKTENKKVEQLEESQLRQDSILKEYSRKLDELNAIRNKN